MKKFATMAISIALIGTMVAGGSLAYLSDTDSDVNVMTVGKVKIVQNEQQRVKDADGNNTSKLEPFKQNQVLLPVVEKGTTEEERNVWRDNLTFGEHKMSRSDYRVNYLDKFITVKNEGNTDAYVRTLLAVPTGGSAWEPNPVAPADTWLHWNTTGDMNSHWYSKWSPQEGHDYAGVFAEINGQGYYVWEFTHKTAIEPGYTTFPTLLGMYMDSRVNHDNFGYYMNLDEDSKYNTGDKRIEDVQPGSTVNVLVLSQAVQADGFDNAQQALDEAFGDVTEANAKVWFGDTATSTMVNDEKSFAVALKNGGTVILTDSIDLTKNTEGTVITKDTVLDLGGNRITANSLDATDKNGTQIAVLTIDNGANVTIKNGTVAGSEYAIYVKDGNVVIENGTFEGHTSAVQVYKGTLIIEDGTFSVTADNKAYTINCIDSAYTSGNARVSITGGTFEGFDPANNVAEGADTNFVPNGYVSTAVDSDTYVVSKLSEIPTVVKTADELKDALKDAKAGETIMLAADVNDIGNVTVKSGVIFDGAGNTISGNSALTMAATGEVTVKNVNFKNIQKDESHKLSAIYCYPTDSAAKVITGCTFDTVRWDGIQVTTPTDSENNTIKIVITDNVFKGDAYRYIHIEPTINKNISADITITGNKMYTTEKTAANIGIFCVEYEGSTFDISNNYVKDWTKFYAYNGNNTDTTAKTAYKMFSNFATDETLTDTVVPAAVLVSTDKGQIVNFYATVDAAKAAQTENLKLIELK